MLKKLLLPISMLVLFACHPVETTISRSAFQTENGKPVERGTELVFPKDHGVHPEQGIEWWYVTAHLQSDDGSTFGVQWTLFRTLMPSKIESIWWDNNLYFAHFALQHKQEHVAFERFARASQANVIGFPFSASIDDWRFHSISDEFLPLRLTAAQEDFNVSLTLSDSPMAVHGDKGFSQKTSSGHASYYFSYPFLKVKGSLTFAGKSYKVVGNAWYDREWSASLLDKSQHGWDWFSLVDTESENNGLMLFCVRGNDHQYDYCSGSRIAPDGQSTVIEREHIVLSVVETTILDNREYPTKWQVELADSPTIIIESITKDSRNQLTIPYWEGRVKASGGFTGKGYAELTGY